MSELYAPTDLANAGLSVVGWSVPEGTAARAAEQADAVPEASATDGLQRDANPPPWPDGAPTLRPYMRLPFRARAEFMDALDPVMAKVQEMPKGSTDLGPKEAANLYRTLADIQDFLRPLADDPQAYDAWVEQADDKAFMALFSAFFAGSQPGEAASSSS